MVHSCLHIVTDYPRPPETDQNMPYLSWKHRNSVEIGKFCGLAWNSVWCKKLWSLQITASDQLVDTAAYANRCMQQVPGWKAHVHTPDGSTFQRKMASWKVWQLSKWWFSHSPNRHHTKPYMSGSTLAQTADSLVALLHIQKLKAVDATHLNILSVCKRYGFLSIWLPSFFYFYFMFCFCTFLFCTLCMIFIIRIGDVWYVLGTYDTYWGRIIRIGDVWYVLGTYDTYWGRMICIGDV